MTALTNPEIRQGIAELEAMMRDMPGNMVGDCMPLRHEFADGIYARTIVLEKGSFVIGKIHRKAHHNFLLRGKVAVLTEDGPTILTAPFQFVSKPGTKRAVYAIEEAEWSTVHNVGEETDLGKIEDIVITPTYEEIGMESPTLKVLE